MTKDDCTKALDNWIKAIQSCNKETVLAQYGSDAVLVPTLSNEIRDSKEKISDYFDMFLAKKPSCECVQSFYSSLGPNQGALSGIYQFTFADQSTARARFTYVFQQQSDKTVIIHHHSSVMPEN